MDVEAQIEVEVPQRPWSTCAQIVPMLVDTFITTPNPPSGVPVRAGLDVAGRATSRRCLEGLLQAERTRLVAAWLSEARASGVSEASILHALGLPALGNASGGVACVEHWPLQPAQAALQLLRQRLSDLTTAEVDARRTCSSAEHPAVINRFLVRWRCWDSAQTARIRLHCTCAGI